MASTNTKTIARMVAIQAIYQSSLSNFTENSEIILKKLEEFYKKEFIEEFEDNDPELKVKFQKTLSRNLFIKTIENIENIDESINNFLTAEWKFENLHDNLKAIIRCGICELKFFPDTPSKVIVSEYTDLSSEMLREQEVGFVNSLLDAARKEIRGE